MRGMFQRAAILVLAGSAGGCALSAGAGWGLGSPDAAPRAVKLSARGPMSRDGIILVGTELGLEVDEEPLRHAALLGGVRIRDAELGTRHPSLELAGAFGVGRESFVPEGDSFGALLGARLDVPIPVWATPSAGSDRVRAIYAGLELVPYAHGDLLYPTSTYADVIPGAEAGLAIRGTFGTDMTLMDVINQVF